MTLELNKPYLVKRVASNGGVLHYLPMDGFCDDIALDAPVLAKRVASNAGVLHYLIGNQQLAADGKLTLNKPYLAKRVASNSGVLHYLVGGKQCGGGDNQFFCGCEICCTLEATLEVRGETSGWASSVDATLTCGGSFEITQHWYCYEEEFPEEQYAQLFRQTWQGGSGSDTWVSGTYDWRTEVWVSDEIDSDAGDFSYGAATFSRTGKYKVFFAATEYTYHEEGEEDVLCCAYEWGVLVQFNMTAPYPTDTSWGFWNTGSYSTGTCSVRWTTDDQDPECPPGMIRSESDVFADGSYLSGVCSRNAQDGLTPIAEGGSTLEGCINGGEGPIGIVMETWGCPVAAACIEGDRIPCTRLSIFDLCEP